MVKDDNFGDLLAGGGCLTVFLLLCAGVVFLIRYLVNNGIKDVALLVWEGFR